MNLDLANELKEQFRRQWETIRESLVSLSDDQWRAGEIQHLVPARLLYHILSGTEVYARATSYEEYVSHRKFSQDWQLTPAEELPDRLTTLGYVDEMEKRASAWLEGLADEGLMENDEGFPWTGSRKLGRAVYLLRHTQNHVGELNAELRRRGLPRGKWR